ncbi:hypothetical protein O6P43_034166 [Quillaja saponaria]|uniref:Uncharacterized protein n=1 Tax=Quillaja saponaria TaxID=32244 RepID=A0AAD7P7D2_QUISA|nr:hypothetical protein O6P43_034166 [Quillaja saponaria]
MKRQPPQLGSVSGLVAQKLSDWKREALTSPRRCLPFFAARRSRSFYLYHCQGVNAEMQAALTPSKNTYHICYL